MAQVAREPRLSRPGVPTVNIGLVGAGGIAKVHAAGYALLPGYFDPPPAIPILKMVADVNDERARAGAERMGFEEWTADYRELVARDDIEIVHVTVPNSVHREIALAAIENGKNVVCEKPLSIDSAAAREMYEAAERAGVRTAVNFQKRRIPGVAQAKRLIDVGAIGDPLFFQGTYRQSFGLMRLRAAATGGPGGAGAGQGGGPPRPPEGPPPPGSWRAYKEYTGSLLGEVGSHVIDMGRHLVGEFDAVIGTNNTKYGEPPSRTDTITAFVARLGGSVLGTFDVVQVASSEPDTIGFQVFGSGGALKWSSSHPMVLEVSSEATPDEARGYTTLRMGPKHPFGEVFGLLSADGFSDSKAFEFHDLLDAFVNDKPYSPDFSDGLRVAEVVDAVLRSAETGQWVELS